MKIGENIVFVPVESTKDADGVINLTDEAGNIRGMITYSKGMKDGPAKNYYSTGRKSDTLHYQADLLDGHWTHWDSVGRIVSIENYSFGRLFGPRLLFSEGKLKTCSFLDYNKKKIAKVYYSSDETFDTLAAFTMSFRIIEKRF